MNSSGLPFTKPFSEAKLQASKPRISANVAGRNAMGSPDLDEKILQRWVDPGWIRVAALDSR